jgi:hypothetical protein
MYNIKDVLLISLSMMLFGYSARAVDESLRRKSVTARSGKTYYVSGDHSYSRKSKKAIMEDALIFDHVDDKYTGEYY